MNRGFLLALGLALTACATPQEQCIAGASRDLQIVTRLIAETEANIARGYALAEVVETRPDFVDCTPDPTEENPDPKPRKCLVDVAEAVTRPVTIDLEAEAAKLASLRVKRAELIERSDAAVRLCLQRFPE